MSEAYEEVQSLIPGIAFKMLVATLLATDLFMLLCTQLDIGMEMWMVGAATVVFAALILLFLLLKIRVTVNNDGVTLKYVRTMFIPMENIIDRRTGDIDAIKNYSGWGTKGVKYRNFVSHGYEEGISLKVKGMTIVTFTSADPEKIASMIPVGRE